VEQAIISLVVSPLLNWEARKRHCEDQSTVAMYSSPESSIVRDLTGAVGGFLSYLPPNTARDIIQRSTTKIMERFLSGNVRIRSLRTIRYWWLRAVASNPCVTEDLLIDVCSKLNISAPSMKKNMGTKKSIPLSLYESCQILLSFWASRGELSQEHSVRREFEYRAHLGASASKAGLCLLSALDSHKELCWTKAQSLFEFLRCLGRPHMVYKVIHTLIGSNVKLPASLVAKEINLHDPHVALLIYRLYPKVRHRNEPLLLDGCEALVIKMINDSNVPPAIIWGSLGVPLYHPGKLRCSNRTLPRARVDLVHKMALAFATSSSRSGRVALRNVMQCAMYLHKHNVPLSADLTRALCYVGITREMIQNHWIGTEKLVWLLDLIETVEGKDVAEDVDRAVYRWHQKLSTQSRRLEREANPLRLGPID